MTEGVAVGDASDQGRDGRVSGLRWKRWLDVSVAGVLFVALAPVIALLGLLVMLDTPGAALYQQERVGLHGRRFLMSKLRTMHVDNDQGAHRKVVETWFEGAASGQTYKSLDDPRITRVGRFLRRFSLDELPQLVNVLAGEMSIVGPRPAIPYELDLYSPEHFERFQIRPGITGLWQVSGRHTRSAREMMEMDLRYVRELSFRLDVRILVSTVPTVILEALGVH
jgi:lipopolysaccharide/colanic/teichoic acid biosynthesis glycosyltransferase